MDNIKVLVIGSGGREHALVWKIAQSSRVSQLFCAPGNPGTAQLAQNVDIAVTEVKKLVAFAKAEKIDMTVVGPEVPLVTGIVDMFERNNLNIIGPSKKAAQIEGSKIFAKRLMKKYAIPTASFETFSSFPKAHAYIKTHPYPLVIKADGLSAGKGVAVCSNYAQAQKFLTELMRDKIFKESGSRVVVEECLVGQEVSFMVATDGIDFVLMLPSQDHKRVFDNDRGPNTGGMGAYGPVPFVDTKLIKKIEKEIVEPTIAALKKEGCIYRGILYPGIILTAKGPQVLEFNCRFGDPETQPLMVLLETDIIDIFTTIQKGRINNLKLKWKKGAAVCVVLTAKGYPGSYEKGKEIKGLAKLPKNVVAFHSGTALKNDKVVSSGGRVIGVTAVGRDLKTALKTAYHAIGTRGIHFTGMHYRKDIGRKGLAI